LDPPASGDNATTTARLAVVLVQAGSATAQSRRDATNRPDQAGDLLDGSGPPPGPVTVEVVSAAAAVVTLGGDHDVASRDAVADAFRAAATGRDLLVDLSECTFVDSTIVKLLLQTMRALEEDGARMELVIDPDPHGHVARVADLMGIADVIVVHATRDVGVRSITGALADDAQS
jgi:anti-anti-sigma factor